MERLCFCFSAGVETLRLVRICLLICSANQIIDQCIVSPLRILVAETTLPVLELSSSLCRLTNIQQFHLVWLYHISLVWVEKKSYRFYKQANPIVRAVVRVCQGIVDSITFTILAQN